MDDDLLTDYQDYKTNLKSIGAQIGFKIRGYSKKEKFQLFTIKMVFFILLGILVTINYKIQ